MSVSDAAIIYLALGAPVAMFRFFQLGSLINPAILAKILFTLFLWPYWAVRLVAERPAGVITASVFDTRKRLDAHIIELAEFRRDALLSRIEKLPPSLERKSLAEALERYVGLSIAAPAGPAQASAEFLSVAGHPDTAIGVVCLERKQAQRLRRHIRAAADDLAAAAGDHDLQLSADVKAIAEILGDDNLLSRLEALELERSDVWNSKSPKRSGSSLVR